MNDGVNPANLRFFWKTFADMARKLRIEVEGGLYHLITRGNDRQDIFTRTKTRLKFLSLLAKQKERRPFYFYAFCLMTNHVHLLIERQADSVGRIMQRILTGYSADKVERTLNYLLTTTRAFPALLLTS